MNDKSKSKNNISERLVHSSLRLIVMAFRTGRKQLLAQLFLRTICGLLPSATALVWQRILTSIQIGSAQQHMIPLFIMLAVIGGLSVSYFYFTEVADTLIRNRISLGLQKTIHKKADELPMNDFESPALADILNRASGIFCYGDAVGFIITVFGIFQKSITIVSIAIVVWKFQPLLAISALILLIPGIIKEAYKS